jgi:hypothetical protein
VLPKVYLGQLEAMRSNRGELIRAAGLLLRVCQVYLASAPALAQRGIPTARQSDSARGGDSAIASLLAAINLLDDFQRAGLHIDRETVRAEASEGPIDWDRTFRSTTLMVAENQAIVDGYWNRTIQRTAQSPLARLQRAALREIHDLFELPLPEALQSTERLPHEEGLRRTVILRDRVFLDRGRRLLGNLEAFYAADFGDGGTTTECFAWAINDFEYVWEELVRHAFASHVTSGNHPAVGVWQPFADTPPSVGVRPRIDAWRQVESGGSVSRIIIDAKWKPLDDSGRAGTADDHYKQAIYSALISTRSQVECLGMLAFPRLAKDPGATNKVQLLGRHSWGSLPWSTIAEVSLDYEWACASYLAHPRGAPEAEGALRALLAWK